MADNLNQEFARLEVGPRKRSHNETPVAPVVRKISRSEASIGQGQSGLDGKKEEYHVLKQQIDNALISENIHHFAEVAEIVLSSSLFSSVTINPIIRRIAFMIDGLRFLSVTQSQEQIRLYTSFFNAIKKYHTNSRGVLNESILLTGEPSNEECSTSLELLFVQIQQLIHGFCVNAVRGKLQLETMVYPSSYNEYMRSNNHYFHFFKMVFVIAKGLLDAYPDQINQIKDMVHFLIRSVCILLSDPAVSQLVGFIFRLHRIARVIHESPPGNRNRTVVKSLTPAIRTAEDPTFPIRSSRVRPFLWLQELIGTNLSHADWSTELDQLRLNSELRKLSVSRSSNSKGGSNKKKSKKSKKSGRNKKVRANKKSKSRRNKKM